MRGGNTESTLSPFFPIQTVSFTETFRQQNKFYTVIELNELNEYMSQCVSSHETSSTGDLLSDLFTLTADI